MKSRIDQRVVFVFALAVGVFIAIGLLSFLNTQESQDSQRALSLSHTKLELLQKIFSDVKDVETSYRGYVLTGYSNYRTPLNDAIHNCRKNLIDLGNIARQEPDPILTERRLSDLQAIIEKKIALGGRMLPGATTTGAWALLSASSRRDRVKN